MTPQERLHTVAGSSSGQFGAIRVAIDIASCGQWQGLCRLWRGLCSHCSCLAPSRRRGKVICAGLDGSGRCAARYVNYCVGLAGQTLACFIFRFLRQPLTGKGLA